MYPIRVLTPAQSAAWDQAAESSGIAGGTLMETAGRAVAQVVATRYAGRLAQGVLVACGTGNNGGDGWVVARALHRLGVPVWVASLEGSASPLCSAAAVRARADGVRQVAPDGPWRAAGLLIDAVLGTGAKGTPRGPAAALITRLADLDVPVVAVDGALKKGIIIADTKFEFGKIDDKIILVDEVLTPDSSRFWPLDKYEKGRGQESYDKQFVRDYLISIKFNMQPPPPLLPDDIINKTSEKYLDIYKKLTGDSLV